VSGRVTDVTEAVIPGAVVVVKQFGHQIARGWTNGTGDFKIKVEAGVYEVTVSAPGFQARTIPQVTVARGEEKVLPPIVLHVGPVPPCGPCLGAPTFRYGPSESGEGEIAGAVLDENGRYVSGVKIRIETYGRPSRTIKPDQKGQFRVTGLTPGTYSLRASARQHADFILKEIGVESGRRTRIEQTLRLDHCPRGAACKPGDKVELPCICL